MDVIVSRSRIPGTASTYHYRALVPLAEVALQRRPRCVVIQARIGTGRAPSTRIADVVAPAPRSEEHTSELQSLMRISYAVLFLKQNNPKPAHTDSTSHIYAPESK